MVLAGTRAFADTAGDAFAMTRQPDEDLDVIVRQSRVQESAGTVRDTWIVWRGGEKQGERPTRTLAIELACDLAAIYSRPAWLLDETGYPLTPIERR